jgi:small subunit ribosomal protein S9
MTAIAKKSEISKLKVPSDAKYATGRRKEATARVWLFKGTGRIVVNGKDIKTYFKRPILDMIINQPFAVTSQTGCFDVYCTVKGSGTTGQSQAIRYGISRALKEQDETFKPILRQHGLLTRDSREVESKKYGKKKARKSPQFSKR